VPLNDDGLVLDSEAFSSQEWMGAPSTGAGTEGPTSLAELQPEASAWDSLDGWASVGGASRSVEADAAASTSAAGSLQASLASVELMPSDIVAGLAPLPDDDSVEADARGALSRLVRRLTPHWLSPRVRGLVLLWALVALVATNWVLVKDAGGLDPLVFCAARFACAAAFFLPFLPEALREETGELLPAGIELGLWTSAGYLTQAIGLSTTDASRASFISTFTVLAVPFLAGSKLGDQRQIKPVIWLSAFGALGGVSLLENGGGSPPGLGDLWSLLSAIFFGVQIYRTEKLSRKLPPKSTFQLMSVSLTVVALVSAASAFAANPGQGLRLLADPFGALSQRGPPFPWVSILWTGLASTDLALLLELTALNTVSSVDASLVYTAEPLLGAGLAFALLGERWGPTGWAGAALIVVSSLAAQLGGSGDDAVAEE
jgi:drug/metabolite transporter (DMT)-like permease